MQVSAFVPRNINLTTPNAQASGAAAGAPSYIDLTGVGAPYATETVARFIVDGTVAVAWCYNTAAVANANLTIANGEYMLGNTLELFGIPSGVIGVTVVAGAGGSTLRICPGDGN